MALSAVRSQQVVLANHVGVPAHEALLFGLLVEPPEAELAAQLDTPPAVNVAFGRDAPLYIADLVGMVALVRDIVERMVGAEREL
jgi:hypothetical protein